MQEEPLVLREQIGAVVRLTLNRPDRRNALSRAMLSALRTEWSALSEQPDVRAVILAARGPVFSSGHDLRELAAAGRDEAAEIFALCTSVMQQIRSLPQPVIAAVQGLATAAGCQLAATCDLAVASEAARFATPGVKIGLFCTTPAVPLSRAIPARPALEMLLTGEPITAAQALQWGLVNRVVPPEQLEESALELADRIVRSSGRTLSFGKRAFYEQLPLAEQAAYEIAQRCMVDNVQFPDAREGMTAFLEKRPPQWRE